MACRICGRNSCTEYFHSLEEQEKYYEDDDGNLVLMHKYEDRNHQID